MSHTLLSKKQGEPYKRITTIHIMNLNTQMIINLKDLVHRLFVPPGWPNVSMYQILKLFRTYQPAQIRRAEQHKIRGEIWTKEKQL